MAKARYHDDDLHFLGFVMETIFHIEICSDLCKPFRQDVQAFAFFTHKADTHKEIAGFLIVELGAVGDIAAICGKECGDSGDNSTCGFAFYGERKSLHVSGFPD